MLLAQNSRKFLRQEVGRFRLSDQNNKKGNDNRGKKQGWLLVMITTLLTSFIVLGMLQFSEDATTKEISYSEFLKMVDDGEVEEVVFESEKYTIIPKKEEKNNLLDSIGITYYTGIVEERL